MKKTLKNEWKVGRNRIRAGTLEVEIVDEDDGYIIISRGDLLDFISALMSADAVVNDQPQHVNPKWLPSKSTISRETVLPERGGPRKRRSEGIQVVLGEIRDI